jgi:hypothetical protein
MDVLLAGNLILPMGGHFAGLDVQRDLPVENVPGKSNTIPGRLKKCSASARNPVHLHPGMVFRISPESCSASSRNRVQLRPDSPCCGSLQPAGRHLA